MDEHEETAALPTSATFTRIADVAVTAGEIDRLIGLLEQDGNYNQIEFALKTGPLGQRLSRAELRAVADEHLRQKPELEPPKVPGKHSRRRRIGWLDLLREKQAELRGQVETPRGRAAAAAATQLQQELGLETPPFSDEDDRLRAERTIIQRQGQGTFRAALVSAYNGYCAVTGCGEQDVLEAAHIRPYRGPRWNGVTNGLLLRADIHTLFDRYLLAVDPATRQVVLSGRLSSDHYRDLEGAPLRFPADERFHPARDALNWRWLRFLTENGTPGAGAPSCCEDHAWYPVAVIGNWLCGNTPGILAPVTEWAARPDIWGRAELGREELATRVRDAGGIACMYALDATTLEDGRVKLNDGVHRWMVARELGLAAVPVDMGKGRGVAVCAGGRLHRLIRRRGRRYVLLTCPD